MLRALAALSLLLFLAGCVQPGLDPAATVAPDDVVGGSLSFLPMKLIDEVRAGGEPVIQITQKGTLLVSAHPGWTHTRYPPSANLLTPRAGSPTCGAARTRARRGRPSGFPAPTASARAASGRA